MEKSMWENWKWQYTNCVTNYDMSISKNLFGMQVTPYYYSLIDWKNEKCPIRKQVIPSINESIFENEYCNYGIDVSDSLAEEKCSPVPNLVHRYPDRVLMLVTNCCFVHCRFCTRKRLTSRDNKILDIDEAIKYIRKHEEVRDVLISGGDPLTLSDNEIEGILRKIKEIKHVQIIRIGTRAPVVLPMRITDELVSILKKYHPVWMNTHFNHPRELTDEAIAACIKICNAGIPLGNQSVLLKDINDNVEVYKELCRKLITCRVRPYYLYQCDLGEGIDHFRTKVNVGINIIEGLRQHITGFAVPVYVIDAPNGGGKIPITPQYVIKSNENEIVLRNWNNERFIYPEVKEK